MGDAGRTIGKDRMMNGCRLIKFEKRMEEWSGVLLEG